MMSEHPIPWEQVVSSAYDTSPQSITRDALLDMFREGQKPGLNFLLVDVRREDPKVSFDCISARYRRDCVLTNLPQGFSIAGSLNIPIQTLAESLPTLHLLCKAAGIRTAIFFCGKILGC